MNDTESANYRHRRALLSSAFAMVCLSATVLCVLILVALLWSVFSHGLPWLSWGLLTNYPSGSRALLRFAR